MRAIAVVQCDVRRGFFGHAIDLTEPLAGEPVLRHTVRRAARIGGVDAVVVNCAAGQGGLVEGALAGLEVGKPVHVREAELEDGASVALRSARKWCLTGWRGGLGAATVFDEALPAGAALDAMREQGAESCVLLRGEWCVVDDGLASRILARHLEAPDDWPVCFSQAAPGLGVVACRASVLESLARHGVGFGRALGYDPMHARADPIGKDVCLPVDESVRDAYRRYVYDTPAARARLQRLADRLGSGLVDADAAAVVEACVAQRDAVSAPRWATVEVTPRRGVDGPIVPQRHCPAILERADMDDDTARDVFRRLAAMGDVPVTLGGLGDALLHPRCFELIEMAQGMGVFGVAVETDLLVDGGVVDRLAASPIDALVVRLNADSPPTYGALMGVDGFDRVMENLKRFVATREKRTGYALPWLVVKFVKTTGNVHELESFYERWKRAGAHPVIERAWTGRDEAGRAWMKDVSPVPMEPAKPVKWTRAGGVGYWRSDGTRAADEQAWVVGVDAPGELVGLT